MLTVREATVADVMGIRDVFLRTYGDEYPYHAFLETDSLTRMVYSDDSILLVAFETDTSQVLGTASVVKNVGAFGDLTAEFGRLAVAPEARGKGVGRALMQERLKYAESQIHVGIVENRVTHPFSQRISLRHGFTPVGYLPSKIMFRSRESVALYLRHFGDAVALRRNNPRVIPEAYPLADLSLRNCGLPSDAIVDDAVISYPNIRDFELQSMTTGGFSSLLRLQRGRVHRREVFGPVRLHYGFFQLQARHCNYLIARRNGTIVGGIGFLHDEAEQTVRIFELLSHNDEPLHFLIHSLEKACRNEWGVGYIEVDVSAHAPRMQQTFLECGFLPCGYLPALVFADVERVDSVRMARLLVDAGQRPPEVPEAAQPIADHVLRQFRRQSVVPVVAEAIEEVAFFDGMTEEQSVTLADICSKRSFRADEQMFETGSEPIEMFLVLKGTAGLFQDNSSFPCGTVERDLIGETSIVAPRSHTLTARALTDLECAVICRDTLLQLIRRRRDIAVILYRNLARSLTDKLRRSRSESDLY